MEGNASLPQHDGTGQSEGGIPLVILAGGRASRLNGDKALAPFAAATLLDAVIARLHDGIWRGPVAINANGDPRRFDCFRMPVLADSTANFPGPLAGILAAMEWASTRRDGQWEWVGTVPTDTPLLPSGLMDSMQKALQRAPDDMIVCAESTSGVHPVIALWPLSLREPLRYALVEEGTRRVRDFIARYPLRRVTFADDGFDPFLNVNSAAELAAAEALWRSGRAAPVPG